jgi:L-glyceraldehyde 3-phosphate reductase
MRIAALESLHFSAEEVDEIDRYATESGVDLWEESRAT